jgi:YbbR domain-containing protein
MMIGWFRQNFRTLLWALLLSVAVWIAAVTAADPDEQRIYGKPVTIEIVGQDPGLVIVGEIPKTVEVTLRAPRSVWERLDGQEQPIRAVVDFSGLSAGPGHLLNVQVQVSENPARVVSVLPTSFTVALEPLTSRVFSVGLTLNGQPATGYQSGNPALEPLEVLVSGAESLVRQVERARVIVNLTGTRESINQELDVQLYNASNQVLKGLSVNPSAVLVNIPVSQQGGYRDVAVKVLVQGQVANGYLLTDLSVFPPIVTVYSTDPGLVNALPGIVETQPLELRGASEDISTRLALSLPAGISVVGEQSVQVDVGISPIQSNLTLVNIKLEVVGLGDELSVQISPAEVDVILSGPAPLLDTLLLQDIRVVVDVTGLAAGTYQLTPRVEILVADVVVGTILPNTVEVVISPSVTPTPGQ